VTLSYDDSLLVVNVIQNSAIMDEEATKRKGL
jgi:hypothetical protein